MSYQANLDIAVAMNILRIASFRKQGRLRFRVQLLHNASDPLVHKQKHPVCTSCSPYNSYKHKQQKPSKSFQSVQQRNQLRSNLSLFYPRDEQVPECEDSYIDHEEQCYYSRVFESKFITQQHPIEQCCYFRKCIKTDVLDQSKLIIKVQLFFKPLVQHKYIVAGTYQATIHKLSGFTTFLPVTFDEFGGFVITGTYTATILEYRFSNEDEQQHKQYQSFDQYLKAATMGFKGDQLRKFFSYYRSSLEAELNSIQEHYSKLLSIVSPNSFLTFVKVNPNQVVLNIISYLEEARIKSHINATYIKGFDDLKQRVSHQISKDFVQLKALIHQKWNEYILYLMAYLPIATEHYGNIYKAQVTDRLRSHAFSHKIEPKWDWTFSRYQDSGKAYLHQAEMDKLKHKEQEMWRDHFPIEVKHFFEDEGKNIKIFEEIYSVRGPILTKRSLSPPSSKGSIPTRRAIGEKQYHQFSPRTQNNHNTEHLNRLQAEFGLIVPNSLTQKTISQRHSQVPLLRLQKLHHVDRSSVKSEQHLVIFVHGFQASRQDFVLFKSCLEIKFNCRVFISSTNQGRTDDSIETLGKRLAVQLNNLFKTIQFGPNTRISFVGHSMGGIIIRSALSYIKNLQSYLYTYMSFSSPHLGYLYEPSALVQAGLWLLNAWQKVSSLQELCMRDSNDPRKSLLYRLSENNSLKGFHKMAFISSSQDEYVPYESARVEKNNLLLEKVGVQNGTIIKEMVDNLLGDIHAQQISRMNVVFNIEDRNFDSLVGRTAHIKYLSDQKFIKMFCLVFQKFFM